MRKIATMVLTFAVSFATVIGGATAANAAPAITKIDLTVGYDAIYRSGIVDLSEHVPPSTQINLTVAACGRVLHTETFKGVVETNSADGSPRYLLLFRKIIDRSMAGPTVEVSVSFSDPAIPPTSATFYTHSGFPRSCDALEPADDDNDNGGVSLCSRGQP